MELRQRALEVLRLTDSEEKAAAAMDLHARCTELHIDCDVEFPPVDPDTLPGRPARPELRHHSQVARRSPASLEGRAVLVHAIAHIEFNAINLALDAIWRFAGMPPQFYLDWLQVAGEEGKHFLLLRDLLRAHHGKEYGDYPAHQGLWTMCEKTADDVTARMALVPRTLEARGLDATPQIQNKLRNVGTPDALATVDVLDIILREEVGHVAIGNHWYRWLCDKQGLNPEPLYLELTEKYEAPRLRPPFNTTARKQAGFTETELLWLQQLA